jgi:hypothetical protein
VRLVVQSLALLLSKCRGELVTTNSAITVFIFAFRRSIIWPVNCNQLHVCGCIEKKIEPTKEGAKHILSHAARLIFI